MGRTPTISAARPARSSTAGGTGICEARPVAPARGSQAPPPEGQRGALRAAAEHWEYEVKFDRGAPAAEAGYYADGAFGPEATRAAVARLDVPVLVYAGAVDFGPTPEQAAEAAGLFPQAKLIVQPGAGHLPWLDDPAFFADAITGFLG